MVPLRPEPTELDWYPRASAELLARRSLLDRTDTKFVLPARDLDGVLAQMRGHYAVLWAGSRRAADYRTLYFDTEDLRCFHDHRRGRRARHKVRIRHYPDRRCSYLELKTKGTDGRTHKQRRRKVYRDGTLTAGDLDFLLQFAELPVTALVPQLAVGFRRITLVGQALHERVTIDLHLELAAPGLEPAAPTAAPVALDGLAIVEVKQSPYSARTPAMLALRAAGVRPAAASKYCTGIALTRSGVRANRFRPTLRAIERISG